MLTSTHVGWKMRGPQETFSKGVIEPQSGFSAEASREKPGCSMALALATCIGSVATPMFITSDTTLSWLP